MWTTRIRRQKEHVEECRALSREYVDGSPPEVIYLNAEHLQKPFSEMAGIAPRTSGRMPPTT